MREREGGSSTIPIWTRHSLLLELYGETAFHTPPPFPQTKEAGCGPDFFSKKVRAKCKISPKNNKRSEYVLRVREGFEQND